MFKYVLGAAALTIAAPVFAQTATAGDPHAGHAGHVQATGQEQPSAPTGQAAMMMGHGEKMDCCKKCCDEENKGASHTPCRDRAKENAPEAPAGHQHR